MVGVQLMGLARVGNFLDKKAKLRNADSEEDNFDVLHESAEKLPILRPIWKADFFKPLQNLARKHIIPPVKDCRLSLLPPMALEQVEGASQNVQNGDPPDWMQELMCENHGDETEGQVDVQTEQAIILENNHASVEDVTDDPTLPESSPDHVQRKKRRLRRNSSHWNKELNVKVRKNANRDDLIRTTKSIIAYIADDVKTDEGTISEIIDDCMRLGRPWVEFSRANAAVESMPFGKPT